MTDEREDSSDICAQELAEMVPELALFTEGTKEFWKLPPMPKDEVDYVMAMLTRQDEAR